MSRLDGTVLTREEEVYRQRTPSSRRHFNDARQYLPGGDSRSTLFYRPYPAVLDRGEGCWVYDLDGNRLLDFAGNHSVLIHGYGHPYIMQAVQQQLRKGSCFPASTEPQLRLARLLCQRIPSLERVRFTNSGTEASINAIRAARAFTGRSRIAKVEGGYHGSLDDTLVSVYPPAQDAGEPARPRPVPGSRGLPEKAVAGVTILPFNDVAAAAAILEADGDELAAVLVEPILGSAGMIPAEPEYLAMLRERTSRHGIVLIFDEVVSLRVAFGGAQEHFRIRPDLTCLGKLIGGGFPLGVFGGREEIMALFDPSSGPPAIPHPGSYNANPIAMVAGAATLELLTREAIDQLNRNGEALRGELEGIFQEAGVDARITGLGSLFGIHLTGRQVRSYRDTIGSQSQLRHQIFLGLYNEGVLLDPRGVGNLSTVIGPPEIEQFGAALRTVLGRVG